MYSQLHCYPHTFQNWKALAGEIGWDKPQHGQVQGKRILMPSQIYLKTLQEPVHIFSNICLHATNRRHVLTTPNARGLTTQKIGGGEGIKNMAR